SSRMHIRFKDLQRNSLLAANREFCAENREFLNREIFLRHQRTKGPGFLDPAQHRSVLASDGDGAERRTMCQMVQRLRHGIHLVVMDAVRKGQNLGPEGVKPRRPEREENLTIFDGGGLRRHAHDLVADWQHVINVNAPVAKVLNEGGAAALILDQNRWLTAGGTVP